MMSDLDESKLMDKSDIETSKADIIKKQDKDNEDPKPRIVLTFRSEKSGAKNSNMKIVSPEEKNEEFSPRRSNRTRTARWDSDDDNEILISPKKDKNVSNLISENEETSDSFHATKRYTGRRRRESSENVLMNAIARKEKSFSSGTGTTRLSRRIKPTPKVLANEELRMGFESQNNARLGIAANRSNDGVKTRKSVRRKSVDDSSSADNSLDHKSSKDDNETDNEMVSFKKSKYFDGVDSKNSDDLGNCNESQIRNVEPGVKFINNEEDEDDDEDDDEEVISRLIEADGESESSSDEFSAEDCNVPLKEACAESRMRRSTRSTRQHSALYEDYSNNSSPEVSDEEDKKPQRRSSRKRRQQNADYYDYETEHHNSPAGGDEASEATCPEEESAIVATCFCETNSNIFVAPEEITEPVFCQAVEIVDEVRVGCSHKAQKLEDGSYAPMLRAGPRSPYILTCKQHALQLRNHMCCPACGLFCSQGMFYQCSESHLFHIDCALPFNSAKTEPGCPHCGVYVQRWQVVNTKCSKVKIEMRTSNKMIYLPEQRLQCIPACLSFSTQTSPIIEDGPIIPQHLLPSPAVDLKELCDITEDILGTDAIQKLCEAVIAEESGHQIIKKISKGMNLNTEFKEHNGGTMLHIAARSGNLSTLYVLHAAGASIDVMDYDRRTPLMTAVLALLNKSKKKTSKKSFNDSNQEEMEVDEVKEETRPGDDEKIGNTDDQIEENDTSHDESLMNIIRYLVGAGCDVNSSDSEGMTALHIAAQHGNAAVCSLILSSAAVDVDARDNGGWTPLVWAAENSHPDVVRLLLGRGADALASDAEGNAALHWCALAGAADCLAALLDAHPLALHALNAHRDTPLHVAARQGHYSCVVILLARGARPDVENSEGETPIEMCGGVCQQAMAINLKMALAVGKNLTRYRVLSNDISNGRETIPIPCINEVDDEPLPQFTYVTQHVMPTQVNIDNTLQSMQGCTCEGACDSACACCVLSVRRWVTGRGLARGFPYHEPPMLFECNQTCRCNLKKCENYLVSRLMESGATFVRTEVFRTVNRGWGLRTKQQLFRGQPVALYCGELLHASAADQRADDQYMFALHVQPDLLQQCADSTQLCVDASQYGSAARFVNHACHGVLVPVRVFVRARDLRLPAAVLVARRHLPVDTELTFDYGDKFWSVKSKWMKCECGAPDCRYPSVLNDSDS